jgi:hypothetical protein
MLSYLIHTFSFRVVIYKILIKLFCIIKTHLIRIFKGYGILGTIYYIIMYIYLILYIIMAFSFLVSGIYLFVFHDLELLDFSYVFFDREPNNDNIPEGGGGSSSNNNLPNFSSNITAGPSDGDNSGNNGTSGVSNVDPLSQYRCGSQDCIPEFKVSAIGLFGQARSDLIDLNHMITDEEINLTRTQEGLMAVRDMNFDIPQDEVDEFREEARALDQRINGTIDRAEAMASASNNHQCDPSRPLDDNIESSREQVDRLIDHNERVLKDNEDTEEGYEFD